MRHILLFSENMIVIIFFLCSRALCEVVLWRPPPKTLVEPRQPLSWAPHLLNGRVGGHAGHPGALEGERKFIYIFLKKYNVLFAIWQI